MPAQAERTFGLVIGIDEYDFITDLHGAVNDARDIAGSLESLGAEVTLLLNENANRAAVLTEWRRIAEGLEPGDRLFVTYAGHGANEPEAHPGSEADGRDETLLLAGFSPFGPASGERIRDDEIGELLALSAHTQTIFVADACHSGSLSRDVSPSLGYRYTSVRELKGDPLPPPPPPNASKDEGREDAALFLAAVDEAQKVPEFLIDGQPRGALSYAFAEGLRGAADTDRNGELTKGELETHVRRSVRKISDGLQRPQVSPQGATDTLIVPVRIPMPNPTGLFGSFDDLPPIRFAHDGPPALQRTFAPLDGIKKVPGPHTADLRFETESQRLLSMVGDAIRTIPEGPPALIREEVQTTVDKFRLIQRLSDSDAPHDITFRDGDGTYMEGAKVATEITGRTAPHVTLVNIAADGTIAYLYPLATFGDPRSLPATSPPRPRLHHRRSLRRRSPPRDPVRAQP